LDDRDDTTWENSSVTEVRDDVEKDKQDGNAAKAIQFGDTVTGIKVAGLRLIPLHRLSPGRTLLKGHTIGRT
jgi:hypothetical protein